MQGFREFLNEMSVIREPGGNLVIAFRQWLYVINHNSDATQVAEAIIKAHPKGQELSKQLHGGSADEVSEWVRDYIPDALVASWDDKRRTLWMHTGALT